MSNRDTRCLNLLVSCYNLLPNVVVELVKELRILGDYESGLRGFLLLSSPNFS